MTLFSVEFLFFFCVTFIVYYLVKPQYRYIWLLIQGLIFYHSMGAKWLLVLLFVVAVSFFDALLINSFRNRSISAFFFVTGVISLVGVLFCFRYVSALDSIGSPIGLSFYTLASIGYLVDVYKGDCEGEHNIARYALFISFFPCVLSGPIERTGNLLVQLRKEVTFSYDKTKRGLLHMLLGFYIKLLIADRLAVIVNSAFDSYREQTGATMMFAVVLFGLQLYADFAGYSYIVIGLAETLGLSILENFRQPYFSTSIREFWGRWHISLSNWLKDYIYIPLGGNRSGKIRQYINLMITFVVSGIWHGRGTHYLIWGILHGLYQIIERIISPLRSLFNTKMRVRTNCLSYRFMRCLFTFCLVDFAWLFFRAPSTSIALGVIRMIVTEFRLGSTLSDRLYLVGYDYERFIILIAEIIVWFCIDCIHEKRVSLTGWLNKQNTLFRWTAYLAMAIILLVGIIHDYGESVSTFIYTRF